MRGIARLSALILLPIASAMPADAEAVPDLSPLACAWDKLPAAEQTRLRDEFKVETYEGGFTILFAAPHAESAAESARACQLELAPAQIEHLALALARRAAEENAKKGITDRGENAESIQAALAKMHEGKREVIGNRLGCPGPHPMVGEWDKSVMGAVRRANLRFANGGAYKWVALGVYAVVAEEGAIRRMAAKADAC